ncbi:MAG: DUF2993 domain-containing protein [Cyanothece sp. SIO1E1]|nr:DUF2993 domain-containing protein [Cyanothece sp. SIO1E1]
MDSGLDSSETEPLTSGGDDASSQQRSLSLSPKHRRMIGRILAPAVRFWLRSQVEAVEALQLTIDGGDGQILSGYIPRVSISASKVVYQGLHLSQVQLTGENIRINLGQVLKGKPLQLLDVIPVTGQLSLTEACFNASLRAPLLANAITEFLENFLQSASLLSSHKDQISQAKDLSVVMGVNQLTLHTHLLAKHSDKIPLTLCTGLKMENNRELILAAPQLRAQLGNDQAQVQEDFNDFKIDLGPEVHIQTLSLAPGQLCCQGVINVIPEAD